MFSWLSLFVAFVIFVVNSEERIIDMPEYKLSAEGQVVDEEGKPLTVGDEPIVVRNARTQEQVDQAVQERVGKLNDRIKALEAQANKAPELEKLLEELKGERDKALGDLQTARESAEQEVASQLSSLKRQTEDLTHSLTEERTARVRDQVTTLILSKAGDRFINPSKDLVPDLLKVHKREPVRDREGEWIDLFEVEVKNEKGEAVRQAMGIEKAIESLAAREDYQHYVRAAASGGSGGGSYGGAAPNQKRSEMNVQQKAEFVAQYGLDKFKALPS